MHTRNPRRSRSSRPRRTKNARASRHTSSRRGSRRPPHNKHSSRHGGGARGRSRGRKMPSFNPSQFINKNPVDVVLDVYKPKYMFDTFGLDSRLVQTISEMGITTPTPIQDQIIPQILEGHDVIGIAETGTGKTAAFLIPIIEKTLAEPKRQTLILTPTRELALQIDQEFRKLSRRLKMFSTICVGGINIRPQIKSLARTNHFIIGTPGRVLDLINRGDFKTHKITTVVLDEADRMLDMGFIHDMRKILDSVPKRRETLFFSATMTRDAEKIVHDFLNNPVNISVKKKDITNSIEQDIVRHGHHDKYETLLNLLNDDSEFKRIIVFGSMKHSVERLARKLSKDHVNAESIHGNKSHGQRQRSLTKFKNGDARVLVATDVAARGIHVDNVSHVINYDLPHTFEDYVHRIGRTGRGTKRGKALTFVSDMPASSGSRRR